MKRIQTLSVVYFIITTVIVIETQAQIASNLSALPPSYNWQEYSFPEYDDAIECNRSENNQVSIHSIFFAQLHAMETDWPFFYVIAHRPLLAEVILSGSGSAPNVKLQAYHDEVLVDEKCLAGPEVIPQNVNTLEHSRDDRYTVTVPKEWIAEGLSIRINAGTTDTLITKETLDVGLAPELNLIQIDMDVLDYNNNKADPEMPDTFLGDFAAAYPASVSRVGKLPARMVFPKIVFTKSDESVVLACREDLADREGCGDYSSVGGMDQLAAVQRFIHAMKRATGDYAYAFYYGNSLNFSPGGWGGDKTFAGAGYKGIFLHEMGHALSLPHWGNAYNVTNPDENQYNYPYGGVTGGGGGRGQSWNYYQNIDEFISPICMEEGNSKYGDERSDGMQRSHWCEEIRSNGKGPWDGFGDFSAFAMFRFLTGAEESQLGTVPYFGEAPRYNLKKQQGYPQLIKNDSGERVLQRHSAQPQNIRDEEKYDFLRPDEWNKAVYTIYGSYHPEYGHANVMYTPLSYVGNLPKLIDPTDPVMFKTLQEAQEYGGYFWGEKDLTFRFTYADGSTRVALYPYDGVSRNWQKASHPWRWDLLYYAITIPADDTLVKAELIHRPFAVRYSNTDFEGNINLASNTITADNFLDAGTVITTWNGSVSPTEVIPETTIIISASDENYPAETAKKAFDGNADSKWLTFNNTGWIQTNFENNEAKEIREYTITSANDQPGRDPYTWTLQGSDDGSDWTTLDERSGECFSDRFESRSFAVNNFTAYTFYRLTITEANDPSLDILQIAEIELLENSAHGIEPGTPGNCIDPELSSDETESSDSNTDDSTDDDTMGASSSSNTDSNNDISLSSSSMAAPGDVVPITQNLFRQNSRSVLAVSNMGSGIAPIAIPEGSVRYTLYSVRGEIINSESIVSQQYITIHPSVPQGLLFIQFEHK